MSQAARHAAEPERTGIQLGQQYAVNERFVGLTEGQEVEVVGVSNATLVNGGHLEEVTLKLPEDGDAKPAYSEMDYHVEDVREAVARGKLVRQ
jgi:hypothetical protein